MKRRKGFTIIEVVLVLAIAGLIFTMVFVALPTLQRSQRNAQRKRDMSNIIAAMNLWKTHNKGSVSDNGGSMIYKNNGFCTFWNRYVGDEMRDPSTGEEYRVALWNDDKKVRDCRANKYYTRAEYDPDAVGRTSGLKWAKMEVGDIQYNDVARCAGDAFDDRLGASANRHIFAFRVMLEGGSVACVDNGFSSNSTDHAQSGNFFNVFANIEQYQLSF